MMKLKLRCETVCGDRVWWRQCVLAAVCCVSSVVVAAV